MADPYSDDQIAQAVSTARQPSNLVTEWDAAGFVPPRQAPNYNQTLNAYSPVTEAAPLNFGQRLSNVLYNRFVQPAVSAVTAPGRVYRGEVAPSDQVEEAKNVASQVMLGSFGAGVPSALREGIDGNVLRSGFGGTEAAAQARELSPIGHYSHAAEVAQGLQPSGSASQLISALKNTQGVKPEELMNAGLLDAQGNVHPEWAGRGKITREDLTGHLQSSMPQVQEKVLRPGNPYPYRDADEWRTAIQRAERASNWDEAQRLTNAWEAQEGYGGESNTKYGKYTLPGGENYREVLLHMPSQGVEPLQDYEYTRLNMLSNTPDKTPEQLAEYQSLANRYTAEGKGETSNDFEQNHFPDVKNLLAHLRMADRTGPNGEKVLHVEEIQSDWGQKGKKEGFDTPEARSKLLTSLPEGYTVRPSNFQRMGEETRHDVFDPNGVQVGVGYGRQNAINSTLNDLNTQIRGTSASLVPSAPYVTNTGSWTDLALKRALKEAAEGGYDKLVWTPGAEQAERYKLSNHVDELRYVRNEDGTFNIVPFKNNESLNQIQQENVSPEKLDNIFGKEVAEKIRNNEGDADGNVRSLSGQELSVGGEGMKDYYDKIVPNQLKKIAKQHDPNAKVQYTDVMLPPSGKSGTNNPPIAAPGIDITPQMRESIMRGQKAFKRGGRTLGNNAIDNALRLATGGDADSTQPSAPITLQDLKDWKKAHPLSLNKNAMDNVFSSRQSGFEGAEPIAMPANLDELMAYLRRQHHADGGRAHFDDGGEAGGDPRGNEAGMADRSQPEGPSSDPRGNEAGFADRSQPDAVSADVGSRAFGGDFNVGGGNYTGHEMPTGMVNYSEQRMGTPYEGSLLSAAMDPSTAFGMGYGSLVGRQMNTRAGASGLLGSGMAESGAELDPSAINPFSGATGLFQDLGARKTGLLNTLGLQGVPRDKLPMALTGTAMPQLGYAMNEIATDPSYRDTRNMMRTSTDPYEAAQVAMRNFERPGIISEALTGGLRGSYANQIAAGVPSAATRSQAGLADLPAINAHPAAVEGTLDELGVANPFTEQKTNPYAGFSSEDPAEIARYNAAMNAAGPKNAYADTTLGQRVPDVTSNNPLVNMAQGTTNALTNLFTPSYGINSPEYNKISQAVDIAREPREGRGGEQPYIPPTSTMQSMTAPVAPYTTELGTYNQQLPSVGGMTAAQWAAANTAGDMSKVHGRIKYVNGAPMLEYYTQ
jgi:hypothetical protein